jgi:hypothetical protein
MACVNDRGGSWCGIGQHGVASMAVATTALTAAALGVTAYSRLLGRRLSSEPEVRVAPRRRRAPRPRSRMRSVNCGCCSGSCPHRRGRRCERIRWRAATRQRSLGRPARQADPVSASNTHTAAVSATERNEVIQLLHDRQAQPGSPRPNAATRPGPNRRTQGGTRSDRHAAGGTPGPSRPPASDTSGHKRRPHRLTKPGRTRDGRV